MPKGRKKTPRQIVFVREYIKDFNAARAAVAAGYSKRSARGIGSDLLAKPHVQMDIQRVIDRRAAKYDITADRVLGELAKLGFANMADYTAVQEDGTAIVDLTGCTRDQMAAIEQIETKEYYEKQGFEEDAEAGRAVRKIKIKLSNKREALELLGKNLRLFNDEGAAARLGVQVILVDIPRPNRPVIDVAPTNGELGNGHNGNGHKPTD